MSSDRAYLHNDYPRRSTTAWVWLVATMVAAFTLQLILLSPWVASAGNTVFAFLALTIPGLRDWHVWTLLTHSLLGSPFQMLFTILGLIFVGRELEPLLGARKFLAVYAAAILLGGLGWSAVHWSQGGMQVGAGAGVLAFLVVLAGINPSLPMSAFYFPVTFRLQHIVYGLLALNLLGLIFYEFSGAAVPLGLSPSAHLGGMFTGWLYFRYLHASNGWDRATGFSLPGWLRFRSRPGPAAAPVYGQRRQPAKLSAEVDRILDKINSHGFGALSDEEKRTLDEAKDMLSKQ